MRDLTQVDLNNKRVLLRADLNVPCIDGIASDLTRVRRIKPTVDYLLKNGAKVIIASHFGRPDGKFSEDFSLAFMRKILEREYGAIVSFIGDCMSSEAIALSNSIKPGEILLLENLRFYQEEEDNSQEFAQKLSELGDVYVNDAFSCSHRAHASIDVITKFLPAYPGFLMLEEVSNLQRCTAASDDKKLAIVAGKKVSTKFKILNFLANHVDVLVIAGAMANTFIAATGCNMGSSYFEEQLLEDVKQFMGRKHRAQILLPIDFTVLTENPDELAVRNSRELLENDCAYDVGPDSVLKICRELSDSSIVLWNGPLGFFEDNKFATATNMVASYIAGKTAAGGLTSVAGGGDTISALQRNGLINAFSYVSTAGGAFLEWLETGQLPGITALMLNS